MTQFLNLSPNGFARVLRASAPTLNTNAAMMAPNCQTTRTGPGVSLLNRTAALWYSWCASSKCSATKLYQTARTQ